MYEIKDENGEWIEAQETDLAEGQKYRFTHPSGATRISYYSKPVVDGVETLPYEGE